MKLNIITGGDFRYFDLINELCESVNKLEDKNIKISVLDGGLSKDQLSTFNAKEIDVIDPGWPDAETAIRAGKKKYLKIELAKLNFLMQNTYFGWIQMHGFKTVWLLILPVLF